MALQETPQSWPIKMPEISVQIRQETVRRPRFLSSFRNNRRCKNTAVCGAGQARTTRCSICEVYAAPRLLTAEICCAKRENTGKPRHSGTQSRQPTGLVATETNTGNDPEIRDMLWPVPSHLRAYAYPVPATRRRSGAVVVDGCGSCGELGPVPVAHSWCASHFPPVLRTLGEK